MFTPEKIAAALIAIAALAAVPSASARVNCRPNDAACRALHGPSTAMERERTRALNRRELESTMPAPQADNGYRSGDNSYARAQEQYRRDMREYARAQRRYDQAVRRGYRRGGPRMSNTDRAACQAMASAPLRQPGLSWSEQAYVQDHEAFAPTGGRVDPNIAAPTSPGLAGATTGLPAYNARSSGLARNCDAPRQRPRRR